MAANKKKPHREIDQKAFFQFAFKGQQPPVFRQKLTNHQVALYGFYEEGMTHREIAKAKGCSVGTVYEGLRAIREKGWPM